MVQKVMIQRQDVLLGLREDQAYKQPYTKSNVCITLVCDMSTKS